MSCDKTSRISLRALLHTPELSQTSLEVNREESVEILTSARRLRNFKESQKNSETNKISHKNILGRHQTLTKAKY